MKSFGAYISKYLASFVTFILLLLFLNIVIFGVTFYKTVTDDYGETSPRTMLELTAASATPDALSEEAAQRLREQNIWALYLTPDGNCFWSLDLPAEIPQSYTIQDVALFSKGYLADYPVFIWNTVDGLLVLGYPRNSYMKLTSNYYSITAIQRLPLFLMGMLGVDIVCLFLAYYCSRRKIIRNTEPIVAAVEKLSDGCKICLALECTKECVKNCLILSVTDDGIGISTEKQRELEEKPHYMESTDERLDLRHGLGLLIVQQIVRAHKGTMQIENIAPHGCKTSLTFVL